jgi:hypothetical protein
MADPVRQKDFETYLARADKALADAQSATLANVRDRYLRAEAAWREMAQRIEQTETMRATSLAARAEERDPVPT